MDRYAETLDRAGSGSNPGFQVVGTAETFAVCRLGVPGLIDRGFPGADGACWAWSSLRR